MEYKDGARWGYRRTLYERVGRATGEDRCGARCGPRSFIGDEPLECQISYGCYDPIDGPRSQKPIETDSEGRFVVEDLPPGKYQFSRLVEYVIKNEEGWTSSMTGTHGASAEVVAGATVSIRIGGEGRTIRGRVVARPNEDGEEFSIGSLESRTMHRMTGRYSPFGVVLDFDEDGAFEIPDVLPGTYRPHFSSLPNFDEPDRHVVPTPSTIVIPEATVGSPEVYDSG
ncbi:MAG: hypothetical protein H6751_05415 [Candidatus Omnitrophica bacterium]|nr:hypothetical protein [Candidatus Omnitrophota bacterium]